MGNKVSIQSVSEGKGKHQVPEVSKGNDWADDAGDSTHNGWSPSVRSTRIKDQGWLDKPAEALHNGWGESGSMSIGDKPEVRSNGWMDEAAAGEYQGWSSEPAKREFNGWVTELVEDDYNGWGVGQDNQTEGNIQHFICPDEDNPSLGSSPPYVSEEFSSKETNSSPMKRQAVYPYNSTAVDQVIHPIEGTQNGVTIQPCILPNDNNPAFSPSAPPIPEFLQEEVNSSPIELNSTTHEATVKSDASSCIICWESPVEGACVPCGHMAGCMSCLNVIKSKKGHCPICRVIRL